MNHEAQGQAPDKTPVICAEVPAEVSSVASASPVLHASRPEGDAIADGRCGRMARSAAAGRFIGVTQMKSIALVLFMLLLCGCAAGRGPAGEVIIGAEVGRLVEAPSQALVAASGFLPPPWNYLATAVGGLLTVGVGAYATNRARDRTDAQYDEAYIRGTQSGYAAASVPGVVRDVRVDPPAVPDPVAQTAAAVGSAIAS